MRATTSRTTSLSAALGAAFAVCGMIAAPIAGADPNTIACQPGQVVIDGQCNVPQTNANNAPPMDHHDSSPGGGSDGGHGR